MGIFRDIVRRLETFYDVDEVTDKLCKRDYSFLMGFSGLYPSCKPQYIPLVILQVIGTTILLLFCVFALMNAAFVLVKLNFTMAVFNSELALLALEGLGLFLHVHVNRTEFRKLHNEMTSGFFAYEQANDGIIADLYRSMRSEKVKHFVVPVVCGFIGICCFIIGPLLDQKYGDIGFNETVYSFDMTFPVPLVFPFSVDNQIVYFTVYFLLGMAVIAMCGIVAGLFLLLTNLFVYLTLHMEYLTINIQNLQVRAETLFEKKFGKAKNITSKYQLFSDDRFILCYDFCFTKCIQHHQLIIRWIGSLQVLANLVLGILYFTTSFAIAMCLLAIKMGTSLPGTFLVSLLFCMTEVFFVAVVSYYGQKISDLSEGLRLTLYSTKWYYMSKRTNLNLIIFEEVSKRTLMLSAFGLATADFERFSLVIYTSYSYYNVIRAF